MYAKFLSSIWMSLLEAWYYLKLVMVLEAVMGSLLKWLKTLERCRVNLCSRWQWIWLGIILCAKPEWVYIVVLKITLGPFVYSRHTNRIWKVIFGSPIFLTIFFLKCKRNISLTIYYIKVKCCTKGYLKFEHIHKTFKHWIMHVVRC